jgi:hypothetical protein
MSKLYPVHSCSVDTFIKILQDGCVKARSRLAPARSSGPKDEFPSVYQLIMQNFPTHFDVILKDKRCPWEEGKSIPECYHCKEKVVNLAEVSHINIRRIMASQRIFSSLIIKFKY